MYHSNEKVSNTSLESLLYSNLNISPFSDKDVDVEVNPLCNILDNEPDSDKEIDDNNVQLEVEVASADDPTIAEIKKEEKIIQKNFDIISKAMFGEVVGNSSEPDDTSNKENLYLNGQLAVEDDEHKIIKNIVDTVLSYPTIEANVIDNEENNCDNRNNRLTDTNQELGKLNIVESEHNYCSNSENGFDNIENTSNCSNCKKEESYLMDKVAVRKGVADEDRSLEHYNSYHYWKVSPELPLDPSIVDAGRSPKKNMKMMEEHNLMVS